jgi:hypothetical protein
MTAETRNDLLWILFVSFLILLWGSIPTWAGYQAETEELRFRGIFFDSQDYAVHVATMEAGRQGEWGYQFRFTTEPHDPAYIRMFYMALGQLSRWLALPSELTFQLARWLLGFLALFALYQLMRQVFSDLFRARTAFLLAAMGSGLGWLQLILNWAPGRITPIDFWLIDAYVFFSLSLFPHFAFVTLGMCLALRLWLEFLHTADWKKVGVIAVAAVLVQFVNPIAFATVDAALLGATLFSWWRARNPRREDVAALLVLAIVQLPLLAYNFNILTNDPVWSQFTAQNQTLSPPPIYYFLGFALFWLPAAAGAVSAFSAKENAFGAAIFWLVLGFALAYAPLNIQRRFLQNITIPLAILAAAGWMKLLEMGAARNAAVTRRRLSLVILFVFLASISSIQIGLSQIAYLQTHPKELYYPASLDHAIDWFHENARDSDFVLASEQTSQVLAQKAGLRAYVGHEMETLGYRTKLADVDAFFQGQAWQPADQPIEWVVYGPLEQEIAPGFRAGGNLELVYDIPDLQIYRMKQ